MAAGSPGMRGQQQGGRGSGHRASAHQTAPHLLGYMLKSISCQLTLESQSQNVHAALIMTMTATATHQLWSTTGTGALGVGLITAMSQTKKQRKAEVWKGDISSSKIRSALGGRMSLGPLTQYTAPRSSRRGDWGWWWQGAPWSSDYRKHIAWTPLPPTLKRAPLNQSPPIQNFCTWEPTRKLLMPFPRPGQPP